MFDNLAIAIVNGILIVGAALAFMGARWVGKLNRKLRARNRAAKKRIGQ